MQVRCPQCQTTVELTSDGKLSDIVCPSCGSGFSLLGTEETLPLDGDAKTIGHFDLVEQVGIGSFGAVWKARDSELDRMVAVKIPRKGQLDVDETEQFLREARAAAQLRHPSIVTVYEVGREQDTVFIVSDFIEGVTLADRLTAQRFSVREAAELCAKIADALQHAHEQGIVHRDLKPGNIILDVDGNPHIMDFGLARREAGEVTMTVEGRVPGTPAYMSPEQAKGSAHTADGRSDVYSLGVILFELLTGERPFRGNIRMLVHQVINDEPPSPRNLTGAVPRDLETIVLKCVEKDPSRRYATAEKLADELRRFVSGEPIEARPVGRFERGWRWFKRNPGIAVLTTAIFVVLAMGVAVSSYLAYERTEEATAAEKARGEAERLALASEQTTLELTLEKAWNLPEQGRIAEGMHWLARCLEMIPENEHALDNAVRANLAAWYDQIHPLERVLRFRTPSGSLLFDDRTGQAAAFLTTTHIIAACRDGYIQVHNLETGRWLGEPLQHVGGITSSTLSPDRGRLITCGYNNVAVLWDVHSDPCELGILPHDAPVNCAAFSPNGSLIITGSENGTVQLWDAATLEPVGNPIRHSSAIGAVAFDPDGKRFLTHDNQAIYVQQTSSLKSVGEPVSYAARIFSWQFSPDGSNLLLGGQEQVVQLRDGKTLSSVLASFSCPEPVHAVAFDKHGEEILAGCRDGTVRRWNLQTGCQVGSAMLHPTCVQSVAYDLTQSSVLTASGDQTIRLWKMPTPWRIASIVHKGMVRGAAFSPDGRHVVTTSSDGIIQEWNVANLSPSGEPIVVSPAHAYTAAYSPDGGRIAIGTSDGVRQWDRRANEWIAQNLTPIEYVVDVAYSPCNSWMRSLGLRETGSPGLPDIG